MLKTYTNSKLKNRVTIQNAIEIFDNTATLD